MKRYLKNSLDLEELIISVNVYHVLEDSKVLATDIKPVLNVEGRLDQKSLSDYNIFIQNLGAMLDYYGFQIIKAKDSKSYPYTSKYLWLATAEDVNKDNIPLMIKLRILDHPQSFSPDREKELRRADRAEAESLKQPKTKKHQRYIVNEITVNDEEYSTYEEALNAADNLILDWLKRLNVDMTDIEPFGVW